MRDQIRINTFDIDGVIDFGEDFTGVRPSYGDIIITGRPIYEFKKTQEMLISRGIDNTVYMNPLSRDDIRYNRNTSGQFKSGIITTLKNMGYDIAMHFEDDPIQIKEIRKDHPDLNIIHLKREDGILEY